MRSLNLWLTPLLAVLAVLGYGPGRAAAEPPPFHVPWGPVENLAAILPNVVDFRGTPPGTNDWSCKPTAAHPEPVVLVSGTSAGPSQNYRYIAPLLANNGYCVFTLTYGIDPNTVTGMLGGLALPGNADMRAVAAGEFAPFIDRVLAATGAAKVDLIGHSQGTIMPRWYIQFLGGAEKVAKSVNLAPLWDGTTLYGLSALLDAMKAAGLAPLLSTVAGVFSHSVLDFFRGSDFMNAVNANDPFPASIEYTDIVTRYDEAVVPYTSGIAPPGPNITNIVLQDACPNDFSEHLFLAADPIAGQYILNALDPENAQPIDCTGIPRNSG
ncbi:esterase/lipase family protein [Nocardia sp. NBC_01388]|uniref:esterase/lipase family protein n=1 Tax=Nocardia sp. NBC_01388 TaxID=2903596 RepID=UPI00324B4618